MNLKSTVIGVLISLGFGLTTQEQKKLVAGAGAKFNL